MLNTILTFFILTICVFSGGLQGNDRPTVCLNMIVKNESHVIERCLASVLPLIDYWVIVDTGSNDGTQSIIREYMDSKGIKGELHERPWVNFEHNRNEALQLGKERGDFLLFIDADDHLVFEKDFTRPTLDKDYYYLPIEHFGTRYSRICLVRNTLDWCWKGVLHEVLCPPPNAQFETLENITLIFTSEGARSKDPQKYQKDAAVLEDALKKDPNNSRYVFYLAQSYYDALNYEKALEYYEKRVEMNGWDQEVYYALLQVAKLQELLHMPFEKIIGSYKRAYEYRKSRLEAIYELARLYREKEDYAKGYQFAKIGQNLKPSDDILFVKQWMYDYGNALELSICAYWIGEYFESQQLCLDLLKKNLPLNIRECVSRNIEFANAKLLELALMRVE